MDSENKCFHKRPVTRPQKEIAPSLPSDNRSLKAGFPIRRFPDQSLFAAPRDLSQRTTSFIASQRQGIHRTPLRHLIALIAKARAFSRAEIRNQNSESQNANVPTSDFRLPISIAPAIRKDQFCFKRIRGSWRSARGIHDWLLEIERNDTFAKRHEERLTP